LPSPSLTTTPVRERSDLQQYSEKTERVKARNKIAAEIMKDNNIPTNDLFGLVEQHSDWHSTDGVHFNGQGKEAQAKQVAESVAKYLPARTGGNN
jgi:lysophospholipase L1-like esterase